MKFFYWFLGGFVVLAILGIGKTAVGEFQQSKVNIEQYTTSSISKPEAVVRENLLDFGSMKVTEEKSADFTIENHGTAPLQLFNPTSSCGCTFGTITINEEKSPSFSMHSKSTWTGSVLPGETASVRVTYKPSIMPVKGPVSRAVYVQTNAPNNPKLTFTVTAVVD